ncbi:hypothetical protein [Massilia niabensis]|uniref:Secreted protein n=1 Tax=Massilia niabensis TaxID=544910 RepID=A0ABW0L7P5_9BURK
MRRAFVIFLILLFPLNVFALSMSVSSMQQAGVMEPVNPAPGAVADAAPDFQSIGDIDPDEPPTGTDFHDSVHKEGRLQLAALPDRSVAARQPSPRGLEPHPPIKPPPV